ncbi:MAG: O-antigen ligase domain-containing protein [Bacteroidetes bacterium]|nr:MAG: O-antigen ligase domain-containing protein [Bacteroidota bacterium]
MSLGQFVLLGNWLLEANFKAKWITIKSSKVILLLTALFLLHLIGCLWTSDFDYAIKDLTIKLPLLILPIIIGTSKRFTVQEWKNLLLIYIGTIFVISLVSLGKLLGYWGDEIIDKREISVSISHIRYGLNFCLAIVLIFYFIKRYTVPLQIILTIIAIWFCIALFQFELSTGLVILIISAIAVALFRLFSKKSYFITKTLIICISFILGYFVIHEFNQIKKDFYKVVPLSYEQEEITTFYSDNGEQYLHDIGSKIKENGVYVWRFVALKEFKNEWSKRSSISLDSNDLKNQKIISTAARFLSSKGLKKDSIGVNKLTEQEIEAIENGIPNVYYLNHNPIQNRVFSSIYEFDNYLKGHSIDGFSLVMRLEYWKTAWHVAKSNFWIGVGTGDIASAIEKQYQLNQSSLAPEYQKRAHNQYLTFWATFGVLGLIFFLVYLFYPYFIVSKEHQRVFFIFLLLAALSFLTEDTLETQAGVTFFTIFQTIILLALPFKKQA